MGSREKEGLMLDVESNRTYWGRKLKMTRGD